MRLKDFARKGIRILNSDWGIGNYLKNPMARLLQHGVNKIIRKSQSPYLHIDPKIASIETTTICNAKCVFCPHGTGSLTRKKQVMSNDLFFRIIDICKKESIKTIAFGGIGEFLCDKDFLAKANYIVKNDLILDCLTTNGMLLNKDISRNLINMGLRRLNISIDSMEKSKYEKIRKGLSFEQVMENVIHFLELNLKNDCKTNVDINATIYKDNIEEKPKFIKRFEKYFGCNFRITFYPIHNWGGTLSDRWKVGFSDSFMQLKTYCRRIFSPRILIRVNGSVSLCCMDYDNKYSLGVIENSIEQLWNFPKIINIRKKHLEGNWDDIAICKECSDIILGKPPIEELK